MGLRPFFMLYSPECVEGEFCNFAITAFSEVASYLCTLRCASNTQVTAKIAHMGDAPGNDPCYRGYVS